MYLFNLTRGTILEYQRAVVEPKLRDLAGPEAERVAELLDAFNEAKATFKPRKAAPPPPPPKRAKVETRGSDDNDDDDEDNVQFDPGDDDEFEAVPLPEGDDEDDDEDDE